MTRLFYIVAVAVVLLYSCIKSKKQETEADSLKGTYFSVTAFAADQFHTFGGQPYSLQKVVSLNGKVDSSLESALDMDWASVIKPFIESDISDKKYLNRYNFTMFEDDITDTRNFYYEAKEPELFTRKLQISSDAYNDKIQSIYVETEKNGKVKKMLYRPVKLIQIQEYESSILSSDKNLKVEYYFM